MNKFNMIIDSLPKSYEGYLINWQFWNGILISDCLSSDDFTNDDNGQIERMCIAFNLLFGNGVPPYGIAIDGLKWFLNCGAEINAETNKKGEQYFSFDDDKERIFSAFMVKYGINLNKTDDLHWFEFIALMNDLDKTAFRNIVDLRMIKPNDMKNYSKEQKQEIVRQKRHFAIKKSLEQTFTKEQIQAIDKFDRLVGKKKG